MEVKFGYLFRKPEKRLELIAKDKATADRKEAKKEVSKDDAMARLREMMRKSGLTKDDLK
jgi:hypothetical protein